MQHSTGKKSPKVRRELRVPPRKALKKSEVVKVDSPAVALSNERVNLTSARDQNMKMICDIMQNKISGPLEYLGDIGKIIDVCLKIACGLSKKTSDRDKLQAIRIFKDCAEIKYRLLVGAADSLERDGMIINRPNEYT